LWPSLLRGPSVVRDFLVENFSSQKPRTREGILYMYVDTKVNGLLFCCKVGAMVQWIVLSPE
jgi:hypothetical protein